MVTEAERRDVAHMLRELRYDNIDEIFPRIGLTWKDGWLDFCRRIADYVEPDTTTDTTKSPEVTTKCDRDALLALADELEEDACWEVQSPGVDNRAWMLKDVCDRIREALGVES